MHACTCVFIDDLKLKWICGPVLKHVAFCMHRPSSCKQIISFCVPAIAVSREGSRRIRCLESWHRVLSLRLWQCTRNAVSSCIGIDISGGGGGGKRAPIPSDCVTLLAMINVLSVCMHARICRLSHSDQVDCDRTKLCSLRVFLPLNHRNGKSRQKEKW